VKRALLVTMLAVLALATSSCGGGGGGQLSQSDFEAQIGAILRPLQGSTLQNLVLISAADPEAAINALKDGESKLHEASSELASMKPPDDAVQPTQMLAKGVGELADEVTAVRKDAERGDFARLVRFKVGLRSDPAVLEIQDAATELIKLGYNIAGEAP